MPWKDNNAMQERIQFICDWLARIDTFSDLCARYDISRKSGYKWIDRYQKEGPDWVLGRAAWARNAVPTATWWLRDRPKRRAKEKGLRCLCS